MPLDIAKVLYMLSDEDYEEAALLRTWENIETDLKKLSQLSQQRSTMSEKDIERRLKDLKERRGEVVARLGYDLETTFRPAKPRGRPKDRSIPDPLPAVGAKLQSVLGETYIVTSYGKAPRSTVVNMISYDVVDLAGEITDVNVMRNISNLFAGFMIGTHEPLVTWPEDPRKLKPKQPIPLNFRRTLSNAEIKANRRELDPDLRPLTEEEKMRRIPGYRAMHSKKD